MNVITQFWASCQKEVRLESQILIPVNMIKRFVQSLIYEDDVSIDSGGKEMQLKKDVVHLQVSEFIRAFSVASISRRCVRCSWDIT